MKFILKKKEKNEENTGTHTRAVKSKTIKIQNTTKYIGF